MTASPTARARLRSLHDIDPTAPLYLYGRGAGGMAFLHHCRLAGRRVEGFIDTWKSGAASDLPVTALDDYVRRLRRPDDVVVVTSGAHGEIGGRLDALGVPYWNGHALAAGLHGETRRFDALVHRGVLHLVSGAS